MGAGGEPDRGGPLDRLLQQRQGFDGVTARGPGLPQAKGLGKRKGLAALASANPRRSWLRGLDLNQRPLGYEPFPNQDWSQGATNNTS